MVLHSKSNRFIIKTIEGLNIKPDDKRLSGVGFDFDDSDKKEEECILVIGLNPAGDENDAKREKQGLMYLYSIGSKRSVKCEWIHNQYFGPIYKCMSRIVGEDKVKWPWHNKSECEVKSDLKKMGLSDAKCNIVMNNYHNHQKATCTIYIGDIFYYHDTNSKKLPLKEGFDYKKYAREMLEMHIELLKNSNKKIKFVYINNAQVSRWLCEKENSTSEIITIYGVKVFYGGMLSGGRMDYFSVLRLVNEIKKFVYKKKKAV